ncbi:MAG: ATP-binding cassette domain-containing protein [Caldilineaceae bacterium]|nr:ATP-binding cassette domain-containing protein [Caldilineaceae bacterium]
MLQGEALSFRYESQGAWVLEQVSLQVAPGEIVGISGPSGRGKTTLAKLLAGYLQPQTGQVRLDGRSLPNRGYCPVQLVFQHPELAMNPRWRLQQIIAESEPPAQTLLTALGIEPSWLARWPHELSGGELQRVAVARALASPTRYLIADEMTAMLDANTQAQIWQAVLTQAQQRQLGLLVISHDTPLLQRLCSRLVTLTSG